MREIDALATSGSYAQHPSIEATGVDITYQIAQAMGSSVTYGWLIESVQTQNGLQGGSARATVLGDRLTLGGDIVTAINGIRIKNTDDMLNYLEEHTLPRQIIDFTVYRGGQMQMVQVLSEK